MYTELFTSNSGYFAMLQCMMLFSLAPLGIAHARLWNGPQQTTEAPQELGTTIIEPTRAPLGNPALFKRTIDPAVCGYVSGSFGDAVGCCSTLYTSAGLDTLAGCVYHTECYDSTAVNQCSGPCLTNTFVMKCTASANPLYFKFTYTDISSSIFGCSTIKTTISVSLDSTTVRTSSPISTTTKTPSPTLPTLSSSGSPVSHPTWVKTTFAQSPTLLPSSPVTVDPASGTAPPVIKGSSSHVGVIAATVIGGTAFILVLIGSLLYFCFRKRN
ncbi:hypothetical protein N431DRAFT_524846 [Stipitochalara longipes BDJ]|nr:hypothetical protein N431DRAFT_524846 [Stipitochalara longipes BDJ]